MVARDGLLSLETGVPVHFCHISTAGSVNIIRRLKAVGAAVTCETCPQYFTLTEDAILERGSLARVNPPLRTAADVAAIVEGLRDGTIDCIATDHAPHAAGGKGAPPHRGAQRHGGAGDRSGHHADATVPQRGHGADGDPSENDCRPGAAAEPALWEAGSWGCGGSDPL